MDQPRRDDDVIKNLSKDDEYDSISFSSLNTCSDISLDRSNEEGLDKSGSSLDDRTWMRKVYLSNESIRLGKVLNSLEPSEIKNILLCRLQEGNSKNLVALGILFPRTTYPYQLRPRREVFSKLGHTPEGVRTDPDDYVQKLEPYSSECSCHLRKNTFQVPSTMSIEENVSSQLCDSCLKRVSRSNSNETSRMGFYKSPEETESAELYV
ncbi:hypothetical protein LSH36_110g05109 [Paralvinella palmiformis]|uniref:Uncharacterized protein n=1 Tax=Paralvinella palmiformis TaxID=53620 RepID=A0AAD9JYU1_9ANNE|nr:hypothetical protein LSH36_110g05109 [Paralvinella palmiformis]